MTRSLPSASALAATVLVAGALLSACGGSSSSQATDSSSAGSASTGSSSAAASGPACTYTSDGSSPARKVSFPPSHATVSGQVAVTLQTNDGAIPMTLDAAATPCTVNSFVSLARQHYFDDTVCHRLTTPASGIAVLQCGDPTGTGSGTPGYSFADELTGHETYGAGTLAMANAGPDTNGSQFFIVYGDSQLSADYTVFGHVSAAGLKVVRAVAAKGTATGGPDGTPKQKVEISSVSVGG